MSKIIHRGVKENGLIDAEIVWTPVLITQLIHDLPKLCEHDIYKRLCEIRESSEQDERIRGIYAGVLKEMRKEQKGDKQGVYEDGGLHPCQAQCHKAETV